MEKKRKKDFQLKMIPDELYEGWQCCGKIEINSFDEDEEAGNFFLDDPEEPEYDDEEDED